MSIVLSNNLKINWSEEKRDDDWFPRLYADIKSSASINQIILELNTAPVDFEDKFTREAKHNGYSPLDTTSPAYVTKEIVLNFEKPVTAEHRNEIINSSIWTFLSGKQTGRNYSQLVFAAAYKNSPSNTVGAVYE